MEAITELRDCKHHGVTTFVWRASENRWRCRQCVSDAVGRARRNHRQTLVREAGGQCILCGYDRYIGALQFHHLDPAQKSFELSGKGQTNSLARKRAEAAKCVLLCANCHAEVEAGIASV